MYHISTVPSEHEKYLRISKLLFTSWRDTVIIFSYFRVKIFARSSLYWFSHKWKTFNFPKSSVYMKYCVCQRSLRSGDNTIQKSSRNTIISSCTRLTLLYLSKNDECWRNDFSPLATAHTCSTVIHSRTRRTITYYDYTKMTNGNFINALG